MSSRRIWILTLTLDPSRIVGATPTDRTSFMPGYLVGEILFIELQLTVDHSQANWTLNNLPEILYKLFPSKARNDFAGKPVDVLRDGNGQPVLEQWPRPRPTGFVPLTENSPVVPTILPEPPVRALRDLPVLPMQVRRYPIPPSAKYTHGGSAQETRLLLRCTRNVKPRGTSTKEITQNGLLKHSQTPEKK